MVEREISLVDLLADIISHWRGVLVCMLVGALLMGGFSYWRSYQRASQAQNEKEAQEDEAFFEKRLAELEEQLNNAERIAVYTVLDGEHEYTVYQKYAESSVLMQMDPYNIPTIDMYYNIQSDDVGQSKMLRSIYEALVNSVGMCQWAEEQTGMPSANVDELITAQAKSKITVLNSEQELELGNDYLKVTVFHYDPAEGERLAQCVKDYIEQQYEKLSQELGVHKVVLLSESAGIVMDAEIRDIQLLYFNTQMELLTNCAAAKNAFTENQQMYYDLLKEKDVLLKEVDSEETEKSATVIKGTAVSVKYVAVGAVLFAFLYMGVLFVLYIFNGKLRATDELQKIYNISQLGLIMQGRDKKFFIDRWIEALINRNKRRFTGEQSLDLAAAAIKISAGKQGLDTVCLMGCDLSAGADVVCRELKKRLEKEKIAVKVLDNVLYDAEAMEDLESVKGIVLVEKAMSTMYNEILRELELASRQGITVLGGIVVE